MRPSNAVRTVWNAGAIDTSHLGFRPIQKIATIHVSSGFIRGIPIQNTPTIHVSSGFIWGIPVKMFSDGHSAPNATADRGSGALY